ncbi:MAG TPA: hypothetical protein VGK06_14985 [Methanosarcina sp.]
MRKNNSTRSDETKETEINCELSTKKPVSKTIVNNQKNSIRKSYLDNNVE